MTTIQTTEQFDWLGELEKTTFKSLVTTFGLDFLLVQDKQGGDVDTIHNVRNGIWATDKEKQDYDNRGTYNSDDYHKVSEENKDNTNYHTRGKSDKKLQEAGQLIDNYTGKIIPNKKYVRHLDHIVSASEIHNDAGRILAELNGVQLASVDSNLQSTYWAINNAKKAYTAEQFVHEILPKHIKNRTQEMRKRQEKLAKMPSNTPQERHEKEQLITKIEADKDYIQALESVDKEKVLEKDKKARQEYNQKINEAYYKSSKFLTATGKQSAIMGVKMGFRQALGLVLAEIWFELKVALPTILKKCQQNFDFKTFIDDVGNALKNIFQRIELRFKDLLASFKDGFLGGVLASISTTIINIFFTTSKLIGKLIRESWQNLVQVAKLMFFNPDNLSNGQLFKEITRIILASIATIVGVVVNQHLATLFTFPLGSELAAFLSALLTGILMIGCAYFIDYSQLMQKVWQFLDNLKDKYGSVLKHLQKANAELDAYLLKLTKLEFNLSPQELQSFSDSLVICADEYQKSVVIQKEIERRNITLPFEMGNDNSTMQWLNSLTPKP